MILGYLLLFWLGIAFGSFINALVWRIHQQSKQQAANAKQLKKKKTKDSGLGTNDYSVLTGRSMCPDCEHRLAGRDLIPILSWINLRGRCRYCKKPIPRQYPLVELAGGLVFALSYYFWPGGVSGAGSWVLFITWLAASVGLLALLVYDFRWMLLPNRIIYPTLLVAAIGRLAYILGFEPHKLETLLLWVGSVAVASGFFWFLFEVSKGKWIGFGDVRLGFITGTVLASPAMSALMIFAASVLGLLFALPLLISGRKTLAGRIPFGPFLIAATWITLLFGTPIIDWYQRLVLLG